MCANSLMMPQGSTDAWDSFARDGCAFLRAQGDVFCPRCAGPLATRWVSADARERKICERCGRIHYENPRILVNCMVTCDSRLLMCRRAHEPAYGLWTPPSGFMETGETLEQAAAREVREEAGVSLDPEVLTLYTLTNLPAISEVYVSFRTCVQSDECAPGSESLEVAFLDEQSIPWSKLAYPETAGYLRLFFQEFKAGEDWIHVSRADQRGRARRGYRVLGSAPKKSENTDR